VEHRFRKSHNNADALSRQPLCDGAHPNVKRKCPLCDNNKQIVPGHKSSSDDPRCDMTNCEDSAANDIAIVNRCHMHLESSNINCADNFYAQTCDRNVPSNVNNATDSMADAASAVCDNISIMDNVDVKGSQCSDVVIIMLDKGCHRTRRK
jgi:hypothetical protein